MLEFKFKFIANNDKYEKVQGFKFRSSKKVLLENLKQNKYTNIKIYTRISSINDVRGKKNMIKPGDLREFITELLDFIKLGNNMNESLEFIHKTSVKKSIKELTGEMLPDLKLGLKLSVCMKQTEVVDPFLINIVSVAEETGNYDEALDNLANYYRDKEEINAMIKGALVKPIVTFLALFGAAFYLITSVIPKIGELFTGTTVQPPFSTRFLLKINDLINQDPMLLVGSIILFFGSIWKFFSSKKFMPLQLRLPIIGKIKKLNFQAQFLMAYYLLVGHGIQTNTALRLLRDNTKDLIFKSFLDEMISLFNKGQQLSTIILKNEKFFDEVVGHMFSKGEKTGTLTEVTKKLYDTYKNKTKRYLNKFPLILDTTTLAIGGALLLFIFSGIISPVITFIDRVGKGRM